MHYKEWAHKLLMGSEIEDKLFHEKNLEVGFTDQYSHFELPRNPGRALKLQFDNKQTKFPKRGSFHQDDRRALALHFFANHELLAIEMMAAALLRYPDVTEEDQLVKKGLIKTIADEQKHLSLYLTRMSHLGLKLGDFPLNDFFWKQLEQLKTPANFYALMALTFESANLDFAIYYEMCFSEVEDFESAKIMKIVFEDEISHVALGAKWLNQWRGEKQLWEYFFENLPFPITPARSKGMNFNRESRIRAGLTDDFIDTLENYRDPFGITNRRNK
jgi:uncharacterized ferritin-like protein (DUF455 family)